MAMNVATSPPLATGGRANYDDLTVNLGRIDPPARTDGP